MEACAIHIIGKSIYGSLQPPYCRQPTLWNERTVAWQTTSRLRARSHDRPGPSPRAHLGHRRG